MTIEELEKQRVEALEVWRRRGRLWSRRELCTIVLQTRSVRAEDTQYLCTNALSHSQSNSRGIYMKPCILTILSSQQHWLN